MEHHLRQVKGSHAHVLLHNEVAALQRHISALSGGLSSTSLQHTSQQALQAVKDAQHRLQGQENDSVSKFLQSISSHLEAFQEDLSSHLHAPSQTSTSRWLHLLQSAQSFLVIDMDLSASASQEGSTKDRASLDSNDSSCSSSTCGSSIASSAGSRLSRKPVASKPGAGYNATYAHKVAI